MESNPLVLSDPNVLAEFAREDLFKTIFEKRFASPPDLAALLFRDGALIDAFKGTQFTVGGLWENIKGVIGGSHHYAIMLADLKPFQVQFPIRGISKDNVEIAGVATLEMQLNPDKAGNILGLMRGVSRQNTDADSGEISPSGRKALSVYDVQQRLEPQFQDRIFEHIIGRHNADEIRGNRGMQDQMQADMMTEAERITGDLGLMVRNGSITFAMNDAERQEFEKARIERQQAAMDHQLELLKREVERQSEATEVKLTAAVDLQKVEQAGEDELKLMVLNSEVSFVDAREAATRRQEAEALDHEIRILGQERAAKFAMELEDSAHAFDVERAKEKVREFQRETELLETKHRITLTALTTDAQIDVNEKTAFSNIKIDDAQVGSKQKQTKDWNAIARENLAGVNEIESEKADRDSDRKIRESEAEAQNRVAQMAAAAGMSAEQIGAITASFSPEAAQAAIAQAQARAASGEKMVEIVREMTAESREHEHRMLDTGMKGAPGVAAGAGGKGASVSSDGAAGSATKVECPSCGKVLSAKDRFCTGCGHRMRT
ncbi:MAG: zinc ribbon domain-containing protein [Pseudomonadota bacterium]